MRDNVTLPLGSIAVTDKIESDYGLISGISSEKQEARSEISSVQ